MPWTPDQFRSRHNKKLSGGQASEASGIANAMMRRGVSEGEAIATANARAEGMPRHDLRHPTTGRFVAASKPKRGMETGFGIKGARPTQ
jgi:hypothetical protein